MDNQLISQSGQLIHQTEYLSFYIYYKKNRKTPIYYIRPKKDDFTLLGSIEYYPHWRKYVFMPVDDTIFDTKCMKDIIYFIDNMVGKE